MKLTLGTVQFGLSYGVANSAGQPPLEQSFAVLDSAWESGIRTLDSAQGYGAAIDVIAQYHTQRPHRFGVINKVLRAPAAIDTVYDTLARERDALLIDEFECVMFHYPPSVGPDVPDDFFTQLRKRGISQRAGLSLESLAEYQQLEKRFAFDDAQLPVNPINQAFVPDDFLDLLAADHVSVHARSVFLQGLLLSDSKIPLYLQPLMPLIGKMKEDAAGQGIDMITACLLYALQKKSINHIVVGAQDVRQWQEIMNAYNRAEAIKDKVILPWVDYACADYDLVHPLQWVRLKAESA